MIGDHPDRIDMLASGDYPDPRTATMSEWSEWVEANYPFQERWEKWLGTRQAHRKPIPGSRQELEDLRGVRDRDQTADLARLWFHLGTPEYERAFEANERFKEAKAREEMKRRQELEQESSAPKNTKRGRAQQWQDDT